MDFSPLSEIDYTEQIAKQNNMDIEVNNLLYLWSRVT